jgi:hypothetical protein
VEASGDEGVSRADIRRESAPEAAHV